MQYTVHLHKPDGRTISYPTTLLKRTPEYILLHARWTLPPVDLGMLRFEPQDVLLEYFYPTCWYNVFALYTPTGTLKGWYCNLARPARVHPAAVESDDLLLDLVVLPEPRTLHLLDAEEYAAWGLAQHDPAAHAAVQAALAELSTRAQSGAPPFSMQPLESLGLLKPLDQSVPTLMPLEM